MDAWVPVFTAIVTAGIPAFVTLVTTTSVKRQANKHSSRQSILQLILEDKVAYMEGKLPENRQAILDEYDEYLKCGGNSYVHKKVEEYESWYQTITKDRS